MIVEENTIVTIGYELREGNMTGQLLEVMDLAHPFIFFYKSDYILDAFQENLRGLCAGDTFAFVIPEAQAYGAHKTSEVATIPIERFVVDDELADSIRDVGQYVAVTDDQGRQHSGKVIEKNRHSSEGRPKPRDGWQRPALQRTYLAGAQSLCR